MAFAYEKSLIAAVTFDPRSSRYQMQLFSVDDGQTLDSEHLTLEGVPTEPRFAVDAIEMSRQADRLATLIDGELALWGINNGQLTETATHAFPKPELPLALGFPQEHRASSCETVDTPEGSFCGYYNAAKTLFVHPIDEAYQLWNFSTSEASSLPFPSGSLGMYDRTIDSFRAAFSPDNASLIIIQRYFGNCTLAPGEIFQLWNIKEDIASLSELDWDNLPDALIRIGSIDALNDVLFSPDGTLFFTASGENIIIWNAETGDEITRWAGHHGDVFRLTVSTDGRRLLSEGEDGTIRLWGVPSNDG